MSDVLLLDCEGLARLVLDQREIVEYLAVSRRRNAPVAISAATIVEADHDKVHPARLDRVLSRLEIEPVTAEVARLASKLLRDAGNLHGHKFAIDAMVAATARRLPGQVTVLTSDPEDLTLLCGPGVRIVPL
jgi:predicted nucleic acid-binding protein